jgi:hypothetical protein
MSTDEVVGEKNPLDRGLGSWLWLKLILTWASYNIASRVVASCLYFPQLFLSLHKIQKMYFDD